ncbi:unnamed protein product, partial [Urochloa humidicola]
AVHLPPPAPLRYLPHCPSSLPKDAHPRPSRRGAPAPADGAWYRAGVTVQRDARIGILVPGGGAVAALCFRFCPAAPPLDDAQFRDLRAGAPLCGSCPLTGGLSSAMLSASLEPSTSVVMVEGGEWMWALGELYLQKAIHADEGWHRAAVAWSYSGSEGADAGGCGWRPRAEVCRKQGGR